MRFSMLAILAGLTLLSVWGLVSPRSQWRALAGAGRRGGDDSDPSNGTVAIHRTIAGLAVVVVGFIGVSEMRPAATADTPVVHRAETDPIRQLWGDPDPTVVDRVFPNLSAKPDGLTEMRVQKFQVVNGPKRDPDYLFALADYARPGVAKDDGYIGSDPSRGFSALDTADLVVQVIGDSRCTPHQVSVIETGNSVVVGVYYGRPNQEKLSAAEQAAPCDASATAGKSTSVLIPIDLGSPLGERQVYTPGGTAVEKATASSPTPEAPSP